MAMETTTDQAPPTVPTPAARIGPVAGMAGVAASFGFSEFLAGLIGAVPSLIVGVATLVIDTVPKPVRDFAISLFGTADKLVLGVGIVSVGLAIGAWVGSRSDRPVTTLVFAGFGLFGALAAARTPEADLLPSLVAGAVAVGVGLLTLRVLVSVGHRSAAARVDDGRRAFLIGAGSTFLVSLFVGLIGRNLSESTTETVAARDEIGLPEPVSPASPPSTAMSLDVDGISPLVTPTSDFYRIDTAFVPPRVDAATWSMRIAGMVDREVELGYDDLLGLDMVERYITIACVSNEVGGGLVGNAKWLGVPLRDVLDLAGVQPEAEQLVGRSVDRFTVGFPVEAAFDGRDALVAVAMNDEALPIEHGFPARLVVAGLYGYVSSTKWLEELHLTGWDAFDAYWIPRGWAKEAPIKTQTRIDTPRPGRISEGPRAIAGVAWAPNRGIERVEVRIDGGPWVEAELAASLDDDSWRQWSFAWTPTPGRHKIEARATDGTGEVQTEVERPPAPDGASGYHTISVTV
ncbi:MAG: molybdopterin-dependent oxidoreductase [Acidimicrobiia bacterium]|nr:molybdopterin-dependent oxidoreductase [Acidimicrobiia bacterium]